MRPSARLSLLACGAALALAASALSGCASRPPASAPGPDVIDPTRGDSVALPPVLSISDAGQAPTAESGRRITLNAVDADARALLVAIAREAGISVVVSDDVRRRVSVSLTNAEPEEVLRAIIAQAGLSVVEPRSSGLPPVVYYQLPLNVDHASADAIAVRFGVSPELARWIVANRPRPERP